MNTDALAPFEAEAHGEATARRFVGMLCLMEFYAWFVCFGISALNGPEVFYQTQLTEIPQWADVILFIGSALPFLCGRGLLRGGRHASRWLVPSLIGIFLLIVIVGAPTAIQRLNVSRPYPLYSQSRGLDAFLFGLDSALFLVPLWVALLALWIISRPGSRFRRTRTAPWVYCAVAYAMPAIASAASPESLIREFEGAVWLLTGMLWPKFTTFGIYGGIILATAVLLLCRTWLARTAALIVAAIHTVALGCRWFVISWLVFTANRAMGARVPLSVYFETRYTVTNYDFIWLFVLPAHYILPWLLIATYAWRVAMRRPGEEGAPELSRYCSKCQYNLYGVSSERCPECGSHQSPCAAAPAA